MQKDYVDDALGSSEAAVIASVNRDGDSDSTGAVTGNMIGAYLGRAGIDAKWEMDLELNKLIVETASRFIV